MRLSRMLMMLAAAIDFATMPAASGGAALAARPRIPASHRATIDLSAAGDRRDTGIPDGIVVPGCAHLAGCEGGGADGVLMMADAGSRSRQGR